MAEYYGKSNLNFTQAGVKWNIKAIDDPANLPAVGKPGEIYILTDKNINKIKKVATIFDGDDLVDNAINLFYQDSTDSKRINYYWGWYFDFKFNSQTILLNNKLVPTYAYFWDMNVNAWVEVQTSYNFGEKFRALDFIGLNYFPTVIDSLCPNIITNFAEELNKCEELEPIDTQFTDEFNSLSFVGTNIDIENLYPDLYDFTEEFNIL